MSKKSGPSGSDRLPRPAPSRDTVVAEVAQLAGDDGPVNIDRQIRRLALALKNLDGRFGLLFGVSNDPRRQRALTQQLRNEKLCPALEEVTLDDDDVSWLHDLLTRPSGGQALVVYGLHRLLPTDDPLLQERTLRDLQLQRELFRKLDRPLLLWMPEYVYTLIGQKAVDFWSWQSGGFFFEPSAPSEAVNFREPEPALTVNRLREDTIPSAIPSPRADRVSGVTAPDLVRPALRGREKEIHEIERAIRAGKNVIVVGQAGSGKTTLAHYVSKRLENEFKDGVYYAQIYGRSDIAATLSEVLFRLDPTVDPPPDEIGRSALYRSLLRHRRVLVVLDDVEREEELRLFNPPPPSQLLALSRRNLNLPDIDAVVLSPLTKIEALGLLRQYVNNSRAGDGELLQLVEWSGGSPLVLNILGAWAAKRPDSIADLNRVLATSQPEVGHELGLNDKLNRSLRAIYGDIESRRNDLTSLLRCLTIFHRGFTAAAAAAITQWGDEQSTQKALEELVDYGLLFHQPPSRYRFHPLLASFFVESGVEVSPEMDFNFAIYYQELLGQLDDLYNQGREGVSRALDIFDQDRANIEAGQRWAAQRSTETPETAAVAIGYPIAGASILPLRLKAEDYLFWLETAIEAARHINDPASEAAALEAIGSIYVRRGERDRAINVLEQSLRLARELGNAQIEASALHNLAVAREWAGDLMSAMSLLQESLRASERIGNRRGSSIALQNLGNLSLQLGDYPRAREAYEEALGISRELGDLASEAQILANSAILAASHHQMPEAIQQARESLLLYRRLDIKSSEAQVLRLLGSLHADIADFGEANEFLSESIRLASELNDLPAVGMALGNLAIVSAKQGRLSEAVHHASRGREIARQFGNRLEEAKESLNLATFAQARGDYREAGILAQEALAVFREIKNTFGVQEAERILSEVSAAH